jgi:hypothetical protein
LQEVTAEHQWHDHPVNLAHERFLVHGLSFTLCYVGLQKSKGGITIMKRGGILDGLDTLLYG